MDAPTILVNAPVVPNVTAAAPGKSPVQPTALVAGGAQRPLHQISQSQRGELVRQCHIAAEESWWRAYNSAPDATAFGRARLAEQRKRVA